MNLKCEREKENAFYFLDVMKQQSERERETDRQTERERQTDRQREREREGEREKTHYFVGHIKREIKSHICQTCNQNVSRQQQRHLCFNMNQSKNVLINFFPSNTISLAVNTVWKAMTVHICRHV